MNKIIAIQTAAGPLTVCTGREFIERIIDMKAIANVVADVEIIGLENNNIPPIVKKHYMTHSYTSMFSYIDDEHMVDSTENIEVIKLPVLSDNPIDNVYNQLIKAIDFKQPVDFKPVFNGIDTWSESANYLVMDALTRFQMPSHFVDFGDNRYAVIDISKMEISISVYNKQIRVGIVDGLSSINAIRAVKTDKK